MVDSWATYRAAYILAAVIYSGYAFSIWWRAKRVREKRAQVDSSSLRTSE